MPVTILNGPTGTELIRRGVDCSGPAWSARAVAHAPQVLEQIHREYADAGADIHVACTFRTQPSLFPATHQELTARAVDLARRAAQPGARIAGSIAPIGDCYQPDQSPLNRGEAGVLEAERLHTTMAESLIAAGADLLLCETFPRPDEGLLAARVALRAARAASVPVWMSLTPGPEATLLTPGQVADAARGAIDLGVAAVLINCVAAYHTLKYVEALARAAVGSAIPFGAYANAGHARAELGWNPDGNARTHAESYADFAQRWADAGATIIGSCCGTGPAHTRELVARFS
ncbi:MAG: homocysteine S-methyltransferase family protein [Phycisphaerales bacterium]